MFKNIKAKTLMVASAAVVTFVAAAVLLAPSGNSPQTIFADTKPVVSSSSDSKSVEVGTRFKVLVNGSITAIRFWKSTGNTGVHTGSLWDNVGNKLANVTFSNETTTGWQTATLPVPISVVSTSSYVVSYHTNVGHYASDELYFKGKGAGSGDIKAVADTTTSLNGVYKYGASAFPNSTYRSTNYWVDATFVSGSIPTTTTQTSTTLPPTTATTVSPIAGGVSCPLNRTAETCWQTHTGVQGGTGYTQAQIVAGQLGFTHIVGNLIITIPGTIIDHYYVEGCIAVKADNVTIRNSLIVTMSSCAGGVQSGGANQSGISGGLEDASSGATAAKNMILSYVTIDGSGADGLGCLCDTTGVTNYNIVADHLDVQGYAKGAYLLGNDKLTESYFHNVSPNAELVGDHLEPIFLWDSSNITIDHNFFASQTTQGIANAGKGPNGTGANTAAIFMKCDFANCGSNISITRNYIRGDSGVGIHGGSINGAPNYQGPDGYGLPFTISDNAFDPNEKATILYWVTISTWTNNFNSDTSVLIYP